MQSVRAAPVVLSMRKSEALHMYIQHCHCGPGINGLTQYSLGVCACKKHPISVPLLPQVQLRHIDIPKRNSHLLT